MSYEQLIALLNKCMVDVERLQLAYMAQVANAPAATLADIKYEAGRLRGIGDFAAYVAQDAKKVEDLS